MKQACKAQVELKHCRQLPAVWAGPCFPGQQAGCHPAKRREAWEAPLSSVPASAGRLQDTHMQNQPAISDQKPQTLAHRFQPLSAGGLGNLLH
eukprot:1155042-Pelagomonas_calceolata.AAC.3